MDTNQVILNQEEMQARYAEAERCQLALAEREAVMAGSEAVMSDCESAKAGEAVAKGMREAMADGSRKHNMSGDLDAAATTAAYLEQARREGKREGKVARYMATLALLLSVVLGQGVQAQVTGVEVDGAVYGGGRMANVNGSTLVTVINCDTLGAVYGGNDIAGTVGAQTVNDSSFSGAQVVIGVAAGSKGVTNADLNVGSVYGGGNGFYSYGTSAGTPGEGFTDTSHSLSSGVNAYDYWSGSEEVATLAANSNVPAVVRTKVSVATDFVYIDSVFGGAKNAYITATSNNSTEINIYGGTMFAVFGGNNYGGTLGARSTHAITVYGTKEDATTAKSNRLGGDHATGIAYKSSGSNEAHGICYLFGGGNKVEARTVSILVKDGQIDTCFAGGNSADVNNTTVVVNVPTGNSLYQYANSPYADASAFAYSPTESVFDIRCLFGGNNMAAMAGIPTLTLTSGGIHNVYGGGNRGVMQGSQTYTDNMGNSATRSTNVTLNSANIICDTIYGGGQSAGTLYDTYVNIHLGKAGTVFGGTNIKGEVPTKSNVLMDGGDVYLAVYGGSNGLYRCLTPGNYTSQAAFAGNPYASLEGEATPVIYETNVKVSSGQVHGTVYGGGNLVETGRAERTVSGSGSDNASTVARVRVHITGDAVIGEGNTGTGAVTKKGAVFGGSNYACVFGYVDLVVDGGTIFGDVYGGNDKTGTVTGSQFVTRGDLGMTTTSTTRGESQVFTSEEYLYNNINSNTNVALTWQNASTYVKVTNTPPAAVQVHGAVYGGGNGDYDYYHFENSTGDTTWDNVRSHPDKALKCDYPPYPNQRSAFVDLNLGTGSHINRVFAGGNGVTVGAPEGVSAPQEAQIMIGGSQLSGATTTTVWMNSKQDPTDGSAVEVDTIFGGNNKVTMYGMPNLLLLRGKALSVYGGGNEGKMAAEWSEGSMSYTVSTYVGLSSSQFYVADNVYGGCNAADVQHGTLVYVTRGTVADHVFGGDDVGGEVVGKARVIVDGNATTPPTIGGNIYGGGNGNYPIYYYDNDNHIEGDYYVAADESAPHMYDHIKGRPYCDSTEVVIMGTLTMNGNVYGGGVSGDCGLTRVTIDAENGVFNGLIFGAGQGRVDNLGVKVHSSWEERSNAGACACKKPYYGVAQGATRDGEGKITYGTGHAMGNVLGTAYLTIKQFKSMSGTRKAIFGGGQSGDVQDVELVYMNTATAPIDELYAGCLASDVKGTAHAVIDAAEPANETAIIKTVYGGNDFTGMVQNTVLDINSGIFDNVYGAGNGDYNYTDSLANWIGVGGRLYDDRDKFEDCKKCADTVPFSMNVVVNFNGGKYLNTVYGGGNMGLVGNRDMDPDNVQTEDVGLITVNVHDGDFHRHIFAGARGRADMKGKRYFGSQEWTNPVNGQAGGYNADYSSEATAAENATRKVGKQLTYGLKILNMDGGKVKFSVYGGSEAVDDGFPYECMGKQYDPATWYDNEIAGGHAAVYNDNTTLRPSTIMNIVGGEVAKSVYGGGYQGNIYGSVYVNIGADAVNDSPVWTRSYTPTGEAVDLAPTATMSVAEYKPNLSWATNPHGTIAGNPTLTVSKNLILETSVYNAADWGEAGENAYFNTRGVYGGETNIYIDGKGYNTSRSNDQLASLPSLDIATSIIGAGTSTEGGDVNRLITIRHYGDYVCPNPSKILYSIQRADKVVLDSVFVSLSGEQDAFMAYATPNYSLTRIDTLIFYQDNIVRLDNPGVYVGNLVSMKDYEVYAIADDTKLYSKDPVEDVEVGMPNDFHDNLHNGLEAGEDCSSQSAEGNCEELDFCLKLQSMRGHATNMAAYNTLVLKNGSYLKVEKFADKNGNGINDKLDGLPDAVSYGHVYGWMYMLSEQDRTLSYVYAIDKLAGRNEDDGGFVAPCDCDNDNVFVNEIAYTNVESEYYRTWKAGMNQGSRTRHITLVANAHPDGKLNYHMPAGSYSQSGEGGTWPSGNITVEPRTSGDDTSYYGYATTTLELPPSDDGNFYIINSVLIDMENGGQLHLTDQAYEKATNSVFSSSQVITSMEDISASESSRNYTFGLTMSTVSSGSEFENEGYTSSASPNSNCWLGSTTLTATQAIENVASRSLIDDHNQPYPCWPLSIISGNTFLTEAAGFISGAVRGGEGVIPRMLFTLTYDKRITKTIQRDVQFTMLEYTSDGEYVGPVQVTITIATVIKDFADLEAPVLAMYNEGVSNQYVRKVSIPAAFMQRDLFLDGIWWDTLSDAADGYPDDWFYLQGTDQAIDANNLFSLEIRPSESSSENIVNRLGWYNIEDSVIDVYATALADYNATVGTPVADLTTDQKVRYSTMNYDDNGAQTNMTNRGILVGTLDGRGTANLDVTLNFNGDHVYHDRYDTPLANVYLRLRWENTKTEGDGHIWLKITLRTRKEGDTIYMAPGPTLTRTTTDGCSITVNSYDSHEAQPGVEGQPTGNLSEDAWLIYDNPDMYLRDFKQAMTIYKEGDVISIMDVITVDDGEHPISVIGDDYSIIQIIRYSGNHYKFPTLGCANYGPMIEVKASGVLTMRNVWLNGSGCTRMKQDTTMCWSNYTGSPEETLATPQDFENKFGHFTSCTEGGTTRYYYENFRRSQALLYSSAPILWVHGKGSVNFSMNVLMTNNFNAGRMDSTGALPGGAILLRHEPDDVAGNEPSVMIGTKCRIYDNVVLDHVAANSEMTWLSPLPTYTVPQNYGGAIYVDGGKLTLGLGATETEVHIARNYYLKSYASSAAGISTKVKHDLDGTDKPFEVYYLDTCRKAEYYSLSNVYLKRTSGDWPDGVRRDDQSDVIYFNTDLTKTSAVGVSKWFPGYLYSNASHRFDNSIPRDTITIARLSLGKSNAAMVDRVHAADVFFNDSSYFSRDNRADCPDDPGRSFHTDGALTTYHGNTTDNPNYNDKVYVFHHSYVNQFHIYLQRCASFGKGVSQVAQSRVENGQEVTFNRYLYGDSLAYHWNKDATCVSSTDSIMFKVGGGFFPYTYTWYNDSVVYTKAESPTGKLTLKRIKIRERQTYGTNSISNQATSYYADLRRQARVDTLVMRDLKQHENVQKATYLYTVEAVDMTGNCKVVQPMMVRVGKITSDGTMGGVQSHAGTYYIDSSNFLRHRNPYAAYPNYTPDGNYPGLYMDFPTPTNENPDSLHICYDENIIVNGNPVPNKRLFIQEEDGSGNPLYYDAAGNKTTTNTGNPVPAYLYYRITAPGVDSSSFHDHVDTVQGEEYYSGWAFLNEQGQITRTYVGTDSMTYDNGIPNRHVPYHTYKGTEDAGAQGGIRRAGYSHLPMMYFRHAVNVGTRTQQKEANAFFGKPYHDAVALEGNGLNDAVYTNETELPNDLYASEMVPRYLRTYRSYKVNPTIFPEEARGVIKAFESTETDFTDEHALDLTQTEFCPGGVVHLRPTPANEVDWDYMAWSYDPSAEMNTNFIVTTDEELNAPVVYFSPKTYWWQHVTTQPAGYQVAYNGDVTITTAEGLAWLISTVNGYNGQNAQTFHFNTVTLDFSGLTDNTANMSQYRWTPIGTESTPFEGILTSADHSNMSVIGDVIVNEKTVQMVGVFGYMNGATVDHVICDGTYLRGNNYVGCVAGHGVNTKILDCEIGDVVLFGEHVLGGVIANATGCRVENGFVRTLNLAGNTIYAGSVFGSGERDSVINSSGQTINVKSLSAVYYGSAIGHTTSPYVYPPVKTQNRSVINNNYFHTIGGTLHQRVGGLVGHAEGVEMHNNYVYGEIKGSDFTGGLVGYMGDDVNISNCYYQEGMAGSVVGYNEYGVPAAKSTTFTGRGNQVRLTEHVDGYSNLTRALNKWVDAHGGEGYKHWRSDLENENNGLPLFGTPDIITVSEQMRDTACSGYEFGGNWLTESGTYVFHVVDSADYLDSTMTLMLTVNYGDTVMISDTVVLGESYEGNGFSISADEIHNAYRAGGLGTVRTFQAMDYQLNQSGCDSLVVLTLYIVKSGVDVPTVVQQLSEVKVYPNPTRGVVHVEGTGLERVEVYDQMSRLVWRSGELRGAETVSFDLTQQSSGGYYVRVETEGGVVVKKVVKK